MGRLDVDCGRGRVRWLGPCNTYVAWWHRVHAGDPTSPGSVKRGVTCGWYVADRGNW